MSVIHEADPPHVDHSQVGSGLLQCPDVQHLIHLPLLLLPLLVRAVQVEELHPVDEVVDLLHEVVQEDGLTQTQTQVLDLCGEGVQFREVSKLSAVREVEEQVSEVGTPVGELLQHLPGDQVAGQLQVPEVGGEPGLDQLQQHVNVGDHQTRDLGSQTHHAPESAVLGDHPPLLAHHRVLHHLIVPEEAEDPQQHLTMVDL